MVTAGMRTFLLILLTLILVGSATDAPEPVHGIPSSLTTHASKSVDRQPPSPSRNHTQERLDTARNLHAKAIELYNLGQFRESERMANQSLALQSDNEDIQFLLGNACYMLRDDHCAEKNLKSFVSDKNHRLHGPSAFLLAVIYQHMKEDAKTAEFFYELALKSDPRNSEYLYTFATLFYSMGRWFKARSICQKSVDLHTGDNKPDRMVAECYYMLGIIEEDTYKNHTHSLELFRSAIEIYPEHHGAHNNAGATLYNMRVPEGIFGHYEAAVRYGCEDCLPGLVHAYKLICRQQDFDTQAAALMSGWRDETMVIMPFRSLVFEFMNADDVLKCAQRYVSSTYSEYMVKKETERPVFERRSVQQRGGTDDVLKIGFLSTDFREKHPTGRTIRDIFPHLAADPQLQLYVYSLAVQEDTLVQQTIRNSSEFFTVWKETDAEIARRIYNDRIDILVDYNGHTDGARIGTFFRAACAGADVVAGIPRHAWVAIRVEYGW
eukprot:Rmarinus@m.10234